MKITEFTVKKLHGFLTAEVPINDNKIILAGVNGIGKSTILNLLYFFLSRQWPKLMEYNFAEISLKVSNRRLKITKEDVEIAGIERRRRLPHFSPRLQHKILQMRSTGDFEKFIRTKNLSGPQLEFYSDFFRLPRASIRRLQQDLFELSSEGYESDNPVIEKCEAYMKDNISQKILYLPTYRRIEKDLAAIFPDIVESIRRFASSGDLKSTRKSDVYLELVEFGMEDVREKVDQTLAQLKDSARASLNSLTASYLRDVIRGQANEFDIGSIKSLTEDTIEKILSRVEEVTLTEPDKRHLRSVITHIKEEPENIVEKDRYVAHYFSKVVDIVRDLWAKERSVSSFIDVCNKYLVDKKLVYDEKNYAINILQDGKHELKLQDLSSGEKQIVSLFSHTYLTQDERFFVIIDEPELSLSVEWQLNFLPDVVKSGNCDFLAAVTHSPFIFDNELDQHAVDLRKHISKS